MPATRKSSRLSGAGAKQSTLSFNHRVTKNVVAPGKKDAVPASTPSSKLAKGYVPESEPETADEVEEIHVEAAKSEAEQRAAKISDAAIARYWGGIEAGRRAKAVHRKHVEGLGTGEKVLRYFDVSSQYGVSYSSFLNCVGGSVADRCVAVHWDHEDEALAAGGEVGVEPACRGVGCAVEGGGEGGKGV